LHFCLLEFPFYLEILIIHQKVF